MYATLCLLAAAPLLAAAQDHEWAGIFNTAATSHTWTMQKVGGPEACAATTAGTDDTECASATLDGTEVACTSAGTCTYTPAAAYAEASMWLVIIPTNTVTEANMETLEAGVAALAAGCADTAAGATITPVADGSCFNLQVDAANDDSTWTIGDDGTTGMAIYAQHVPTEFERDAHYLKDSSGTDIDPFAVEGDGDHAHGEEEVHAHGEEEVCACAAAEEEHPFGLDCTDTDAIGASATLLESATCVNTEEGCDDYVDSDGVKVCKAAYFHLHFIHGWCGDEVMTTEQEELLHTYEAACPACHVSRPYSADDEDCAAPTCTDLVAAQDAVDALAAGCTAEGGDGTCCTTPELIAAWRVVLSYHDLCEEDDVPQAIEMAKHDYAHACEDHMCNTSPEDYDATVCPPEPEPEPELVPGPGVAPPASGAERGLASAAVGATVWLLLTL